MEENGLELKACLFFRLLLHYALNRSSIGEERGKKSSKRKGEGSHMEENGSRISFLFSPKSSKKLK